MTKDNDLRNAQIGTAVVAIDSLGLCVFAAFAVASPEGGKAFLKALSAKLGTPQGPDALAQMGIRALQAERAFNHNAGVTSKDDRVPEFFYKEALPPHNAVFAVTNEDMIWTLFSPSDRLSG